MGFAVSHASRLVKVLKCSRVSSMTQASGLTTRHADLSPVNLGSNSKPSAEIVRQVRAWRFASRRDGAEHGALSELDGEEVRVLRVSAAPAAVAPARTTGDGKLWILETEPA